MSGADILTRGVTRDGDARLERVRSMPDSEIDFSDLPESTPEQLAGMRSMAEFWKARKRQVTLRIDADVLAWFQKGGAGYLTRMNDALRAAMVRSNRKHGG